MDTADLRRQKGRANPQVVIGRTPLHGDWARAGKVVRIGCTPAARSIAKILDDVIDLPDIHAHTLPYLIGTPNSSLI